MNNNLIWFVWFLLISIVAFLLVPRKQLFRLLPIGIIAGYIMTLAILLLNVPLLNLWAFDSVPANSMFGVPLSLPLAFVPVMMLFAHYVHQMSSNNMLVVWITAFAVVTTLIQGLSVSAGIIRFLRWDLLASLLLSFSVFSLLALFVQKYGVLAEDAPSQSIPRE